MNLKLKCGDVDALLDAFEDDEIDGVTSLRVQKHLDACTGCRARHGWLRVGEQSLRRIKARAPGPSAELKHRIAALPDGGRKQPLAWRSSLFQAAAMLVVASALAFLLLPQAGVAEMDVRMFVQSHKTVEAVDVMAQLSTRDTAEAAAWLRERLPDAQPPSGAPPGYQLAGARITEVAGQAVGLFVYQEGDRKISCFVPSGPVDLSLGFDEIAIKEAGFTAGRCRGQQIVSWSGPAGSAVVIGELSDSALLAFATANFGPVTGLL